MISVTQQQKEILNACGIEVIEYKRQMIKSQKIIDDIAKAFVECLERLIEVMKPVVEAIKKCLESEKVSARDKYKLCKTLGIDYRPYIKRNQAYRCRNNC